jgi:hypothetical protein
LFALGTGEDNTPSPGKVTRTLVAITVALLLAAPRAIAQQPDSAPGVRLLRLRVEPLRFESPPPFDGAGRLAAPHVDPAALARRWEEAVRARLAVRAALRWRAGLLDADSLLAYQAATVPEPVAPGLAPDTPRGPTLLRRVVDLGLQLNARFEMRWDRLKNLRCTAVDVTNLASGCRGGFTPPRLEPQFNVRTGGIVGERIHVNVDYDSEREFEASNNIQVYYQGKEDEVLRRVQVGNVTFTAPASRFITGNIPSNNFGAQFEGQFGALDFSGIIAQQKGNVVRGRTFTIGDRTVQPIDRTVVDRHFEQLRFFFVVDPATLPGYPAVDVLGLVGAALPAAERVTQVRVYRRRSTAGRPTSAEQNLVGIEAVAVRDDSPQRAGPFPWEALIENRDYYLDPSGLWFVLASRLDQEDYLAVSYVTAAGDTVGTFPAVTTPGRVDTLRLIYEPRRGAEVPTFRYEMRNAYRVGSVDDVLRISTRLQILVAESERPTAGAPTFLSLFGLALESDATTFDQYNRLWPRGRDPNNGAPVRDYFIIFPHLTPFADSTRLAPAFRNDSLYRTPTYLLLTQGPTPLYQLRLMYDATGGDDRNVLSLGGFQIREGSERLTANGRPLLRNVDYTVNYEIGQVTFLNPDSLFQQPTTVTVQYEENPAFAIAPTSIYGLQARYDMGDRGAISLLGLLQRERTTFTRPPLGFEPSSNLMLGVAGNFRFEPRRLTRWLDALPLIQTDAPSLVTVDAELATSRPSPNQVGVAYVETFEAEGGAFLSMSENAWEFGSRPSTDLGLAGTGIDVVGGFRDDDAVSLVWQNLIASAQGAVEFRARDIDPLIRLQGAGEVAEPVLWLSLHPDTVGGLLQPDSFALRWVLCGAQPRCSPYTPGPRWRSMTLPLSTTGLDLSRVEFLEFWLFEDGRTPSGTTLVFDLGTVLEDAVDFWPAAFRVTGADTVYLGRQPAGVGRLDTERDTLTNAFNAAINDLGILGDVADSILDASADTLVRNLPLCQSLLAGTLVVYNWGNVAARCTRRNGQADTEDLDNDGNLDINVRATTEEFLRYVFRVGVDSLHVRPGGDFPGFGQWHLYRIPFRTGALKVGDPNLRLIRALRLTVVAPPDTAESTVHLAMARMKLVGAPWVKRAGTPIPGLAGSQGAGRPTSEVIASVVSTENRDDLGYEPPPGVTDEGASRGGEFQVGAQQINEKSLRLVATDVRPGERAEAFFRFPEGDRNFLGYRQLRLWARGRGAGWDENHLAFYVKIAQDENNFYLYRANARTTSWEPEAVVDFARWLRLRAEVENRYLLDLGDSAMVVEARKAQVVRACGLDTLAYAGQSLPYVACDTLAGYLVHVRNPGVAPPNLSRVQELAVGILRDSGNALDSAELWVDDIRLTQVVDDAGYAGAVSVQVTAADIGNLTASLSRRDATFRQLGEDPSYLTQNQFALATSVRLERIGLERLGITLPFSYRTDRSAVDPYYLARTDVLASGLTGLRRPRSSSSSYSFSMRRSRRGSLWWQRALVDNIALSGAWSSGNATTELSTSQSRVVTMHGEYAVQPGEISFRYLPGFLRGLVRGLPGFLRRSELVRGLTEGRLRLTPSQMAFTTDLARSQTDRSTYRVPIATAADSAIRPVSVTTSGLRSSARTELRPLGSAQLFLDLTSERDLRDYGDSTTVGRLARDNRRQLAGVDVGFERQRVLNARFTWTPPVASWLRPRFSYASTFGLTRDPNSRTPERTLADSSGGYRLPTAFTNTQAVDLSGAVDLSRALRGLFGDSAGVLRVVDRVQSVDLGTRTDRRSQFDRPGFDPSLSYQLGFGGRDAFRRQGSRFANAASESRQHRLGTTVRLPLNVQVQANYQTRTGLIWALRGAAQQELRTVDTDWPNLTSRWSLAPRRGPLRRLLTSLNVTASLRVRESESIQPPLEVAPGQGTAQEEVRSSTESRSIPLGLSVIWLPRIQTSVSWATDRSRTARSGTLTLSEREQLTADLGFSFRVPPDLVPLRSDVRTTLRFASTTNTGCVESAQAPGCTRISDSRRKEYTLIMDTDMPPNVTAGLSVSYVLTEDAHTNRKFSQFVLLAHARVTYSAGELR